MIYPDNQIVIKYPFEGLNLLAAYDVDGDELNYNQLTQLAEKLEINLVQKLDANSIKTILEKASNLDKNFEGFVLRFAKGFRLKIKGSEYCRIHKLISGVTPLGIWECLKNGDDLEFFRKEIPEEYWTDFDQIYQLLLEQFNCLVHEVETTHLELLDLSDKEVGLILSKLPEIPRKFIFSRRKDGVNWQRSPKIKEKIYSLIRPTENFLSGYSESQQLHQVKLET